MAASCVLGLTSCTAEGADEANQSPIIAPGKPGEANKTLSPEEAREAAKQPGPNDADYGYAGMMIVHHRQAIEMSDLAEQHAVAKNVRGIAARIADAQGPEIDMMNRWLEEHGKPTVAPAPEQGEHGEHGGHGAPDHGDMPGMATEAQMSELAKARGEQFDRLFLHMMIKHHEGALTMARDLQLKGMDIRVQEWADEVIATQSAEIGKMRAMLGA